VKEEEPVSKEEVPVSSPEQPKAVQKADSIDIEDSLANLQPEAVENSIHNTSPPQEADLPEVTTRCLAQPSQIAWVALGKPALSVRNVAMLEDRSH